MLELYSTWQQMVRESVYLFLARYTNCSKYIQKEKKAQQEEFDKFIKFKIRLSFLFENL